VRNNTPHNPASLARRRVGWHCQEPLGSTTRIRLPATEICPCLCLYNGCLHITTNGISMFSTFSKEDSGTLDATDLSVSYCPFERSNTIHFFVCCLAPERVGWIDSPMFFKVEFWKDALLPPAYGPRPSPRRRSSKKADVRDRIPPLEAGISKDSGSADLVYIYCLFVSGSRTIVRSNYHLSEMRN
jgi:hypothetical protein